MGNLSFQIPFTFVCLGVSSFALCGIPFLAGFYSKDLILEMVSFSYINLIVFFIFCFYWFNCLLFIAFILLCFCGDFNLTSFYSISESNLNMLYGIIYIIYL
jgi:NADH-ubiquinone oxidoreductase chain 5